MAGRDGEVIQSLANDSVKRARALSERKARRDTGLFLAEGRDMLERARAGGFAPEHLFVVETAVGAAWAMALADWATTAGARVSTVTQTVMARLSAMANPSSVAAVLRQRHAKLPGRDRLAPADTWIVLEELRDPGNLGSIVRTTDAAGAKGIILAGDSADPFSPEAVRASTGSIFAVPVVETSLDTLADWITGWPGLILGSAASGAVDYREAADPRPVLLLIGSEANGLSARLTGHCHRLVRIPMTGTAESLNAAIATAVLLFEIQRPFLGR